MDRADACEPACNFGSDEGDRIENVSHWNMNSKRMEAQARWGDILVVLGGSEGVLYLANLNHDAGKPVVPLNAAISGEHKGARRIFSLGLSSRMAPRFFQSTSKTAHDWINKINFTACKPIAKRIAMVIDLLEGLEKSRAFAVRLLNREHADFNDVEAFFETVVKPIVEDELGYRLVVVDGKQPLTHALFDQEIFVKLHRSAVVLADITGLRPNCLLELGYALGRCHPTMLTAKEGTFHPSDLSAMSGLHWRTSGALEERRAAFREHWPQSRAGRRLCRWSR